ncbi:MAG: chromosome segregation SMC family protein [Candidatus Pacearchaeota archaeon]
MPYIKKLVMKGFKSFAQETEILFNNGMNVIVGPNGSGKSNITEAICFVLGRKSAKSMRAEKSSNFIFSSAHHKPMWEASVKIVFDNSDKKFPLQEKEITIERIVRRNGISIYKINNEIKTRQEVLELLSNADINPYGFNIILQGEIMDIIKMSPEERRRIIEEVAGISIYEQRKEKSLLELEKTDAKLKEAETILRERISYLKKLEEERKQALKFQELQEMLRRCKASILKKRIEEKTKNIESLSKEIKKLEEEKEKIKRNYEKILKKNNELEEEIKKITKQIENSSGIEGEKLYNEITQIRANISGLEVQLNNFKSKLEENKIRQEKLKEELIIKEKELEEIKKGSTFDIKAEEIEKKRKEIEKLEKERTEYIELKTKFKLLTNNLEQKKDLIEKIKNEINFLFEEIKEIELQLQYHDEKECREKIFNIKNLLENKIKEEKNSSEELLRLEKENSSILTEIKNIESIKEEVKKIDKICPLCKSKITEEHIKNIEKEADEKISDLKIKIEKNNTIIEKIKENIISLREEIQELGIKEKKAEIDLIKLISIEEKKRIIRNKQQELNNFEKEISLLETEKLKIEKKINEKKDIEEVYDNKILELQEISSRSEKSSNVELEFKQIEIQKIKNSIKQSEKEKKELEEELEYLQEKISEENNKLSFMLKKEKEFEEKYKYLIKVKNDLQNDLLKNNKDLVTLQTEQNNKINIINSIKIEKAKLEAEKENFENDLNLYKEVQFINGSIEFLEDKIKKLENEISMIGSINMLALKEYDSVKNSYDEIYQKVEILKKEKEEIIKIIEEVDKKKIRTFMKTLTTINELMNRNFMQLSNKGQAYLELENKENPFEGGLEITLKIAKGKYFDVSSLSGGEKSLVALSLIFAIQEYKPYPFYILDEVDASLDKRNSEKLAFLIKKYMKSGQYIIVTHNDALISEAPVLYGVSMQDGISKVISLEI